MYTINPRGNRNYCKLRPVSVALLQGYERSWNAIVPANDRLNDCRLIIVKCVTNSELVDEVVFLDDLVADVFERVAV